MVSQESERKTLKIDPSPFIKAAEEIATNPTKIERYRDILKQHKAIIGYCWEECRQTNCALSDCPEKVYDTYCQVLKRAGEGNLSLRYIKTD